MPEVPVFLDSPLAIRATEVYRKYERYYKKKTKLHAYLPLSLSEQINVGDLVKIQECRPLSKIIHFIVLEKIKSGENAK